MEKLPIIIDELKNKKGREFVGLNQSTEKQLKDLSWYLQHPTVNEKTKLMNELIILYDNAKRSGFLKMESINRKLSQLKVIIGEVDPNMKLITPQIVKEKPVVVVKEKKIPKIENIEDSIHDLVSEVEDLLESQAGKSLPQSTQESLSKFLDFLTHPDLPEKGIIFEEMHQKFYTVENEGFLKMQAFNDMLNKLDIKLGKPTSKEKKIVTRKEQRDEIAEGSKEIEQEKLKLKEEWEKLKKEREKFNQDTVKLLEEKIAFEKVQKELEEQKMLLQSEKAQLRIEKLHLKEQDELLQSKMKRFENILKKVKDNEDALNG